MRYDVATSWHDELTRGWRIERTTRGNAVFIVHRRRHHRRRRRRRRHRRPLPKNEASAPPPAAYQRQHNERTARGDATTSWCNKTTRERRNERTTRGDATISWHDETTPGRCEKRRHNLVVVWLQTESIGEVAAIVIACIKHKLERLCVGDESQHLSNVVQNGLRTLRHRTDMRAKMEHPSIRVSGCPNKLWLANRPRVLE